MLTDNTSFYQAFQIRFGFSPTYTVINTRFCLGLPLLSALLWSFFHNHSDYLICLRPLHWNRHPTMPIVTLRALSSTSHGYIETDIPWCLHSLSEPCNHLGRMCWNRYPTMSILTLWAVLLTLDGYFETNIQSCPYSLWEQCYMGRLLLNSYPILLIFTFTGRVTCLGRLLSGRNPVIPTITLRTLLLT
jgi:hypothetical protein